jgi:tetratricopeptide (TPR) repeat protein
MKRRIITIVTIIFFAHLSVFSQTNVSGKAHPRYYLIVGAYSTLQDANDAVDNLKLKGFAAEVVPGLTDYGTYRVAYCSYDDKDAAQQKTNQMKAQGYTSVWIYTGNVTDTNVQNNAPVTNNQNKGKITTQEQPPQFKNADERAAALKKALNRASAAEDIANQSKSKEDWQSVIEEYKNVTKIDPANSLSYYKIGYASETIEDYDNAIIYYNKYLQVDPKSSIAEKVQTNIDKLEYKRDKSKKQVVLSKSVNGLWESDLIDKKTKRPYWIFTIDQFDNDMRVSVSPKSFLYKPAFTFPTAIALKDKNKLHFMFTTDVNINIKEDLNAASSILNALDGVQSAVSSVPVIGAAASIIGAVPAKAKNDKSTYIFSLDLSDTTKLSGKYNAK